MKEKQLAEELIKALEFANDKKTDREVIAYNILMRMISVGLMTSKDCVEMCFDLADEFIKQRDEGRNG